MNMNGNYLYPSKDPMAKLSQEMRIRNFSQKTIKSYLYYNKEITNFKDKFFKVDLEILRYFFSCSII